MDLIATCVVALSGILLAIIVASVSRLLADDIKAWLPRITAHLIKRAVRLLPEDERRRYEEEWKSYVDETPGDLSKLYVAAGFSRASKSILKIKASTLQIDKAPKWERAFAGFLLLILGPLFLVICIAIKADSAGPVMFRHRRLSKQGQVSFVLKFRTMAIGSDILSGKDTDPRITRVGKFLRRTSIDELPSLISVLTGHARLISSKKSILD